jgi:hypothetical protein
LAIGDQVARRRIPPGELDAGGFPDQTASSVAPGQDALDVALPQREPVVVPRGKVADVQRDPGEPRDLGHLSLREDPIGDSALIENLDGACKPPAREPIRSWLARRSTIATSTPANASSPANISPVGPPPAITTACFGHRNSCSE